MSAAINNCGTTNSSRTSVSSHSDSPCQMAATASTAPQPRNAAERNRSG